MNTDSNKKGLNSDNNHQFTTFGIDDYQNLLMYCADSVIIIDQKGEILFFNETAQNLWGYNREEVVGKKVNILMPTKDSTQHDQYLDNYLTTGISKIIGIGREVEAITKYGKEVPILLTLNEIKKTNQDSFFVAFIKDITEKRKLQKELADELERAKMNEEVISKAYEKLQTSEDELRQNMEELVATQEAVENKNKEIQQKVNFYDQILNAIGFPIFVADLDQNVLFANKALGESFDRNIAEHFGSYCGTLGTTICDTEDCSIRQLKKGNSHVEFSERGIDYHVDSFFLNDLEGRHMGFIEVIQDVTKLKQAERDAQNLLKQSQQQNEDLKTSEEELKQNMEELVATQEAVETKNKEIQEKVNFYEQILDTIDFPLFVADMQQNVLYTNKALKKFELSVDSFIGSYCGTLGTAICDTDDCAIRQLKKGNNKTFFKYKDYEFDVTSFFLSDLDGEKTGFIEVLQDVTELNKANREMKTLFEKLKISETNMRGQIKAINASYALAEFTPKGIIIKANDRFLDVMGYQEEEVQGKHHSMFVKAEYAQTEEYQEFWTHLAEGFTKPDTYERVSKSGKVIWLDSIYSPVVDDNGQVVKIIKLANDVSNFRNTFNAIQEFLGEIRQGNLDVNFDSIDVGNIEKDLVSMIEDNLELKETLKQILGEVNRVVKLAGKEGQLMERLKLENQEGVWAELVSSLNDLLDSISQPVMEINQMVTAVSMGDLTPRFDMQAEGDVKDMGNALNIALRSLNNLLNDIEKMAQVVEGTSKEVNQKSLGMRGATAEASTAVQQMADGAQEQASRTDESSRLVENTLKLSTEVSQKAEIISKSAEKGQQDSEKGLSIIGDLVANMEDIAKSVIITSKSIDVLNERSEEISRILNVINDITFQTKLLAVNANIEAARAGEVGRGFKVVAEQIDKLSEDSKKATIEIDKIIKDVQKDVGSTIKAIDEMKSNTKNGNEATNKAKSIFDEITSSSNQTFELSKNILQASSSQKNSIQAVVRNIEQIVVVAEETATGTQEVANSAKELDKSMQEVTDNSNQLSEVAEKLKEGLSKFKLVKENI